MADWQSIFKTEQRYKAEIVKAILEDKGFMPVIVSKKDSSYNNFGQHEIIVAPDEVMAALKTIQYDIDIK